MEATLHCTGCGYPIGDEHGGAEVCPECGRAVAESRRHWDGLGGEQQSMRRLALGGARLMPLWFYSPLLVLLWSVIYFFVDAGSPWLLILGGLAVPFSILSSLQAIEFIRLWSHPPMGTAQPARLLIALSVALPWFAASGFIVVRHAAPASIQRLVESIEVGGALWTLWITALFPSVALPMALATFALRPSRGMRLWRSRFLWLQAAVWCSIASMILTLIPFLFLILVESPGAARQSSPKLVDGMQLMGQVAPFATIAASLAVALLLVPVIRASVSGAPDALVVRQAVRRVAIRRAWWGGALFALGMWLGIAGTMLAPVSRDQNIVKAMAQVVGGSHEVGNLAMIAVILSAGLLFSIASLLPLLVLRGIRARH